jgi:hypothetical protein
MNEQQVPKIWKTENNKYINTLGNIRTNKTNGILEYKRPAAHSMKLEYSGVILNIHYKKSLQIKGNSKSPFKQHFYMNA